MLESSELVMNDGKIINNKANRYGGGIYAWAPNVTVEINGGEISGNIGRYAGGITILGEGSKLFLHGGKIINNTGETIHGGGIFFQPDLGSNIYLGEAAVVCDNKLSDGTLSDIYHNGSDFVVYIDSALTGDIAFTNPLPKKNLSVLATNNYTLTESDAAHLRFSSGNLAFYLDKDTNTIKYTTSQTVTFHSNTGDDFVTTQKVPSGYQAMLCANDIIRDGYKFAGWNTKSDGTGDSYQDRGMITTFRCYTLCTMGRNRGA